MNLLDRIRASNCEAAAESSTTDENHSSSEDLFCLSGPTSSSLQVLVALVYASHHRANLLSNDCNGLRRLAAWLAPFPHSNLPYKEPIPKFLQSYTLWQLAAIIHVPPAKLWPVVLETIVEAEKNSLDKREPKC